MPDDTTTPEPEQPASRVEKLTQRILDDRAKEAGSSNTNIIPCFACGRDLSYRGRQGEKSGRFCSMRCQDAYDAGFQPQSTEVSYSLTGWRVVAGPPDIELGSDYYAVVLGRSPVPMKRSGHGFKIECQNPSCRKEFESLGLRYCGAACERRYREHRDNLALMEEAGMDPPAAKRPCANPDCTATIPKWRKGKAVSLSVKCCSTSCQRKVKKLTNLATKAKNESL